MATSHTIAKNDKGTRTTDVVETKTDLTVLAIVAKRRAIWKRIVTKRKGRESKGSRKCKCGKGKG